MPFKDYLFCPGSLTIYPSCNRKHFRASVFRMKQYGFLARYQKPLLHFFLLIFIVGISGGVLPSDLAVSQTTKKVCFSIKVGPDAPSSGFSQTDQLFHVAPTLTAKIPTDLRIAVTVDIPKIAYTDLILSTLCRAPPFQTFS